MEAALAKAEGRSYESAQELLSGAGTARTGSTTNEGNRVSHGTRHQDENGGPATNDAIKAAHELPWITHESNQRTMVDARRPWAGSEKGGTEA
jgi:hypothetical protein